LRYPHLPSCVTHPSCPVSLSYELQSYPTLTYKLVSAPESPILRYLNHHYCRRSRFGVHTISLTTNSRPTSFPAPAEPSKTKKTELAWISVLVIEEITYTEDRKILRLLLEVTYSMETPSADDFKSTRGRVSTMTRRVRRAIAREDWLYL
jgi:hypothetical protein